VGAVFSSQKRRHGGGHSRELKTFVSLLYKFDRPAAVAVEGNARALCEPVVRALFPTAFGTPTSIRGWVLGELCSKRVVTIASAFEFGTCRDLSDRPQRRMSHGSSCAT